GAAGAIRAPATVGAGLLGVQLDDELLLDRGRDLPPLRLAEHLPGQPVVVGLQPRGDLAGELGRVGDQALGRGLGLDRDDGGPRYSDCFWRPRPWSPGG